MMKNKTKKVEALTPCDVTELEPLVMQIDDNLLCDMTELEALVIQIDDNLICDASELEAYVMRQGGRVKSLRFGGK